jgi:2-polyprenyl-6-methoxyphenol hydroxylase-like FAD-dependent oxidoreductase
MNNELERSDSVNQQPTTGRKALIVGGGIGGPVAAMALQRAGIEATVYEARDRPDDHVGLFLNTASNGLDVLKTLDAHAPVIEDAFPAPRMVMWSGAGKRLGEVPNGARLPDGTVSVIVKRGFLQRALAEEAMGRGIKIEYGKRLADLEVSADGAGARFTDGTEAEGDLLIGADGIHSRTRRILDPTAPKPGFTGLLSLGGFSRNPLIPPTPDTQHFVFGKRAFFGYLVKPSGEIYWFANLHRPTEPSREELGASSDEWKRHLRELFSGDMDFIGAIIEATHGEIGVYPVHDIPTASTWHRGPVALIGDAVHAVSPSAGQGASLAMEDALVVAMCLRDIPDAGLAFAAYERLRRERAERVVAYSRRIGNSKVAGPVARRFRDLMMPFALKHIASRDSQAWMYRHHIDWEEKVVARANGRAPARNSRSVGRRAPK